MLELIFEFGPAQQGATSHRKLKITKLIAVYFKNLFIIKAFSDVSLIAALIFL